MAANHERQIVQSSRFITWEKSCNRGMFSYAHIKPAQPLICVQWGPKGIRVNSLCPGYMKTDLIIDLLAREGRHIEDGWVKDVPMGRLGRPSELQGTIVWMASDASSYLNGSDIVRAFHPNVLSEVQSLTSVERSLMVGTAVGEKLSSNIANMSLNLPTNYPTLAPG